MSFRFGSLFCRNAYLLPKQILLLALPYSITGNVVQMCVPVKARGVVEGGYSWWVVSTPPPTEVDGMVSESVGRPGRSNATSIGTTSTSWASTRWAWHVVATRRTQRSPCVSFPRSATWSEPR